MPGKKATGTKTEISTSEVATTAPVTSRMAAEAAVMTSVWSSWMWRWMFSKTTIASSTTRPVASVIPKRVKVLIEKPKSLTKAKAPTRDTGMVIAGMTVLRQSWRKRKMTAMTKRIASRSVISTSRIDSPTTVVVSKATR